MKHLPLCLMLLATHYLSCQSIDYQWWNDLHGWDGISPFERYLHLEPGKTGPNALPVPELVFFHWDSLHYLSGSLQHHHTKGEHTISFKNGLYFRADRKVAFKVWMVAAEYFSSNEVVRDFRAARTYEGRGWAIGDLYAETHWHIVQYDDKLPDISLRIGLKTASGSRVEDVRFTDTPGYYFDLNFRKLYVNSLWRYQWYGMAGFYAYQTYRTDYKQNDAFLYGVGGRANSNKWGIDLHVRGYIGYFSRYDKPLVGSFEIFRLLRNYMISARIEHGNVSWPFTGMYVGYMYRFL